MIFNGLNISNIKYILDNDPEKQEKYLYGTNFQVKSPKILKNFRKPTIIIRVGVYRDEIIEGILKINSNSIFI